ncbi:MAG: hypothetical protein K2P71_10085, partial [Lachnospiraceae bacterium]|nr:hypothetical protein [Lachnospiraceae bacterium]
LLSQGWHRCEVAVLYPVMAVEGGIESDRAVQTAFDSVRILYENGIDVDFIDYESILDAVIRNGRLEKAGESYRIIILPEMRTVRLAMIKKLEKFCQKGGIVWGIGEPPRWCDSWDNTELSKSLARILFGVKPKQILDMVGRSITADVIFPDEGPDIKKYMLHRFIDGEDFYMVYGGKTGDEYGFHVQGNAVFWNPYDGKRYALSARRQGEYMFARLPLSGSELQLISFSGKTEELPQWPEMTEDGKMLPLSDEWDFSLVPCLDNRYGDYSLPASDEMLGVQVKALYGFRSACREPEGFFDRGVWCRCGFGPYYLKKGPFSDREEYEEAVKRAVRGELDGFLPYNFSMRYGRWDDPGVQGYHGLKGKVSDDFLTMGKKVETPVGTEYNPEENGVGYIFATTLLCQSDCEADILCGEIEPEMLFADGVKIGNLKEKLRLSRGKHQIVAAYERVGRTHLLFSQGESVWKEYPLSMKWYRQENILPMNGLFGDGDGIYDWFWFEAPPALEKMEMAVDGEVEVWIDGIPARQERKDGVWLMIYAEEVCKKTAMVVIRVLSRGVCSMGACFIEPIRLYCGEGRLKYGDWGEIDGLSFYSGKALYRQVIEIGEEEAGRKMILEIDDLSSSARVWVNGREAGTKAAAPWRFDLTPFIKSGSNELRICVSNTLTNHYRSIPSRYCGNGKSGILTKGRIWIY